VRITVHLLLSVLMPERQGRSRWRWLHMRRIPRFSAHSSLMVAQRSDSAPVQGCRRRRASELLLSCWLCGVFRRVGTLWASLTHITAASHRQQRRRVDFRAALAFRLLATTTQQYNGDNEQSSEAEGSRDSDYRRKHRRLS
jgi:hypothetical protein